MLLRRLVNGGLGTDQHWYGLIRAGLGDYGGFAVPGAFAAAGQAFSEIFTIAPEKGNFLMAHEIAHNREREHAPCLDTTDPDVLPAGVDDNWPNATNPLALLAEVGFDVITGEVINPQLEPRDMMSYCAPDWITTYTYNGLLAEFETNSPAHHRLER